MLLFTSGFLLLGDIIMSKGNETVSNKLSKETYKVSRILRDVNSVEQAAKQKSIKPIIKRLIRKWLGRKIASKIFKIIK